MRVIIPCQYLKSVVSKAKEGKEPCTYHSVLVDLDTALIKDKDNKLTSCEPMQNLMLECYANVYNGKIFLTLIREIKNV